MHWSNLIRQDSLNLFIDSLRVWFKMQANKMQHCQSVLESSHLLWIHQDLNISKWTWKDISVLMIWLGCERDTNPCTWTNSIPGMTEHFASKRGSHLWRKGRELHMFQDFWEALKIDGCSFAKGQLHVPEKLHEWPGCPCFFSSCM